MHVTIISQKTRPSGDLNIIAVIILNCCAAILLFAHKRTPAGLAKQALINANSRGMEWGRPWERMSLDKYPQQ